MSGPTDEPARADLGDTPATMRERARMVERQLRHRDISDPRVLAALAAVPRHAFVPGPLRAQAYADGALPIGDGQTISQPYIVGLMTQLLALRGGERVLEIGTGSGYQTAVLAALGATVYSIELNAALGARARATLAALGYAAVSIRIGDGAAGWPEAAPFDALIVAAGVPHLPAALLAQLRDRGRAVVPLEREGGEELSLGIKDGDRLDWSAHGAVRFVPMTGTVRAETPGAGE